MYIYIYIYIYIQEKDRKLLKITEKKNDRKLSEIYIIVL